MLVLNMLLFLAEKYTLLLIEFLKEFPYMKVVHYLIYIHVIVSIIFFMIFKIGIYIATRVIRLLGVSKEDPEP